MRRSEPLKQPNQIAFASTRRKGSIVFYVDQDPIYLDVYVDGSSDVNIRYYDGPAGPHGVTDTNIASFEAP